METGRYTKLPLEERFCQLCNNNAVEDELHFLCVCPTFNVTRTKLYDDVCVRHPGLNTLNDEDKLILLLTKEQKCIGEYIYSQSLGV